MFYEGVKKFSSKLVNVCHASCKGFGTSWSVEGFSCSFWKELVAKPRSFLRHNFSWVSRHLNTTDTDHKISRNALYRTITWLCQTIKVADLAYAALALTASNTWQALEVICGQIRWADGDNRSKSAQVYASRYEDSKIYHLYRSLQAIPRIGGSAAYKSETRGKTP